MDEIYRQRNELAAALARLFPSCIGIDPEEPDWPVLYIQLPSGQVSYHFSPTDLDLIEDITRSETVVWDGHTNEDKSLRLSLLGMVVY